jgi:hypothetical protein
MPRIILALVAVLALALSGCCIHRTMRCDGSKVQYCTPDKKWRTIVDCKKIKRTDAKWCCKCPDPGKKCKCAKEVAK